jgi:putative transposase
MARRELQMRRFKSDVQAQRFLSVHGVIQNLFRVGRHHLKAIHHRLLRDRAFSDWKQVTSAGSGTLLRRVLDQPR